MHDVIEGIGGLSLDENATPSQLVEQPEPSKKLPKWAMNTLESVCLNERLELEVQQDKMEVI